MNKGLKNYTKQFTEKVGDVTTNVNLFKDDANLHITVPLLSTSGLSPFSSCLIYNHQDKDENGIFGKGFRLNFFAQKSLVGDKKLQIKNADGSIDEYNVGEWNQETQTKATFVYDDNYKISYHVELCDKDENKRIYGTISDYPSRITAKSGDIFDLDFVATTKTIKNQKGDLIRFIPNSDGKIGEIQYLVNGDIRDCVVLSYSSERLTMLTYKTAAGTIKAKTVIEYADSSMSVYDHITEHQLMFSFVGGRVEKVSKVYSDNFTNCLETKIEYSGNMTKVTNWQGDSIEYYFDNTGLPLFQLDSDNYIVETEYDSKTKLLMSQSSPFLVKGAKKNYFAGMSMESFSLTDVTRQKVTNLENKWKNLLGDSVYEFKHTGSGSGYIIFEVPIDCVATDNITAVFWGRQKQNHSSSSYTRIEMQIGDKDVDTFKKPVADENFEAVLLGATCTRTENSVRFFISLVGDTAIELGGIQIVKKDFGAFYEYNSDNNATLISKCGEKAKISYSTGSTPKQITDFDTTIQEFEHNSKGYPTKSTSAYGIEIVNEYSSAHPSLLTKQTLSNEAKDKIIETRKTYTSDGRHVEKEYDEFNECISTSTYNKDKLVSAMDALGAATSFEYYDDLVKSMILRKDNKELSKATYTYDVKRQLSSVTLKNGSKYEFGYDYKGNLVEVKINGVVAFAYTYDDKTGNVLSQKQGVSGDSFEFEYNKKNQISKVHYVTPSGTKSLRFSYVYNTLNQLVKICDAQGKALSVYEYDDNGNVKSISNDISTIKYSYDNVGNKNSVAKKVQNRTVYETHENVSRSQSVHPSKMALRLRDNGAHACIFDKSAKVINGESTCKLINDTAYTFGKDGALPFIDLKADQTLAYQLTDQTVGNYELGCVKFWFKTSDINTKRYIFGVQGSSAIKSHYSVYIDHGSLYLEILEKNASPRILLMTQGNALADKWNFFALNFYLRDDGLGYGANCEVSLTLNAETRFYTSTKSLLKIDVAPNPIYYIGHRYDGHSEGAFSGQITCLAISPRWNDSYTIIKRFYNITKDYIENCQYIDAQAKTLDISETIVYAPREATAQFDVFPLNNSVMSLKGTKPTKYRRRDGVPEDVDKSFTFNSSIGHYVYVADGTELAYKFGQSGSGTVLMRAYTNVDVEYQYLFEGKDADGNMLGLYRDREGRILARHNGEDYGSYFEMPNNEWCTIGLSFERSIPSSYGFSGEKGKLRVYFNGRVQEFSVSSMNFSNIEFQIGRRYDEESTRHCTGTSYECYPLYGQIEMLCASNAYCSKATISNLVQDLKCITTTNEFDDFGMLKQSRIKNGSDKVMTKTIDYKTRQDTKYLSQCIAKETFDTASGKFTREYSYDKLGNVTKIAGTMHGGHSYEYDARGFLTKEDSTVFAYDANGNITQAGSTTMSYDTTIKDRLVKVGTDAVVYDDLNPLNPKSFKDKEFTFEGRRLVRYKDSGNDFTYKYDEQGLRIEKKSTTGATTKFVYDGTKLICEIAPSYRLDFLYDENDELYGFIKDGSSKYFYVRDFLQNITGIIDSNGKFVVKYNCSAYGNVSVLQDTNGLAAINPFLYKGYYFDKESGMFYCHTRYYVPEWCRWLNADHILYVSTDDMFQMNLFAYCGNDPISRADNVGNSWESFWSSTKGWFKKHWKEVLIGTAFIVGGAIVSALTCGTGTAAVAAFGSALLSSVAQVGASIAVGVVAKGIENVINGDNFFDDVGDTIASSFMWGGILSGGSQIISGGFRLLKAKLNFSGINKKNFGFMSPDKLYHKRAGMTVLRIGKRNGVKVALDLGRYGIHAHLFSNMHTPLIPFIVGLIVSL